MPSVESLLSAPITSYKRKSMDNELSEIDKLRAAVATYSLPVMNKSKQEKHSLNDSTNVTAKPPPQSISSSTPHTHQYKCTICNHTIYYTSINKSIQSDDVSHLPSKRYDTDEYARTQSSNELQQITTVQKQLDYFMTQLIEYNNHTGNIGNNVHNDKCVRNVGGTNMLTNDYTDGFIISSTHYKHLKRNNNNNNNTIKNNVMINSSDDVDDMFQSLKKHKKSKKKSKKHDDNNGYYCVLYNALLYIQ